MSSLNSESGGEEIDELALGRDSEGKQIMESIEGRRRHEREQQEVSITAGRENGGRYESSGSAYHRRRLNSQDYMLGEIYKLIGQLLGDKADTV